MLTKTGGLALGEISASTQAEFYALARELHDLRIERDNAKGIILPMMRAMGLRPSKDMVILFQSWEW